MMDNKLSELSKPVAWKFKNADGGDRVSLERKANIYGRHNFQPCYSQEYVSALKHESAVNWEAAASLNVENQELKKRITELESANKSQDDHINQQQDRIDSLEKTNAGLGRRLGDAEKRLATPVRLLGEMLLHDWEHRVEQQATFQHRKIAWDARLAEDKKAILAAGFTVTVEGDDQ
ncbi:hypothetical protein [Serratia marcescens]|uniref:hypothetical protein n=1 Tax=Serratia marcescens TaxID=615 RepID=UPI003D794453